MLLPFTTLHVQIVQSLRPSNNSQTPFESSHHVFKMKKRTYSQRGKHQATYQSQRLPSPDPSNKRRKTNKSAVSKQPPTPPPSRGGTKDGLSKAGLKQFNGPISVPSEDIADEGTARQVAETSVFDEALIKKLAASRPVQPSIYGSREEFLTTIKKRKAASQSAPEPTKTLLPTPPSDTPEDQSPAVCANTPTPEPTQKKKCLPPPPEVEQTAAPRKSILGHRLSKRSEEAKT